MRNILRKLGLWIGDGGAMRGDDLGNIHCLQTLERVQVVLHIALRRGDHDGPHTCYDVTGEEYASALQKEAEVVKAMPWRMHSSQDIIPGRECRAVRDLLIGYRHALALKGSN